LHFDVIDADIDGGHEIAGAKGEFAVRMPCNGVTRPPMTLPGKEPSVDTPLESAEKLGAGCLESHGSSKGWRTEHHRITSAWLLRAQAMIILTGAGLLFWHLRGSGQLCQRDAKPFHLVDVKAAV
jgi:hypothetical protein